MTPAELEDMLVTERDRAAKIGAAWAEYAGKVNSCEDRKTDYLAELTLKAEGKSIEERERIARTSPEWAAFRKELSTAEAHALILKIEYQVAVRAWETARSLLSSKNQEARGYR